MPNFWSPQDSFISGEWSRDVLGRTDLPSFQHAAEEILNYLVKPQGGAIARPGTRFYAAVKNAAHHAQLFPFSFNVEQSYAIEAGDQYFRFYIEAGRLEVAAVPVEVATPYLHTDLALIQYTQSADVLYLVHPSHPPQELRRTAATTFTMTPYDYQNGPFQDFNGDTAKTLNPSATTGTITVTASGHTPFTANHVGSIWAIGAGVGSPEFQGYVRMTAFTSTTEMDATVIKTLSTASATDRWAPPAWSNETGWPTSVRFHDARLIFGGAGATPQHWQASVIAEPNNHAIRIDGMVTDDAAIVRELASEQVNRIRWMVSLEDLFIGTSAGWWRVSAPNDATITPGNLTARKRSSKGGASLQPVIAGETLIFLHRAGRRIYAVEFDLEQDRNLSRELTAFNQAVTGTGVVQLSFEDGDIPIVWVVRADGLLATCTYDLSQRVVAWSRQRTDGLFKSIVTIPRATDEQDLTWTIVEREINGETVKYVELFDSTVEMDSAITGTFGSPVTTVTGLGHLEAKTVEVKVDGARQPQKVVTGAEITGLFPAATEVTVGLPFTPTLTLTKAAFQTRGGTTQGRLQHTGQVSIDVISSYGIHVNGTQIETRRASDPIDAPPPLFTGTLRVGGEVLGESLITMTQPFPFRSHIRSVQRYVEIEDD